VLVRLVDDVCVALTLGPASVSTGCWLSGSFDKLVIRVYPAHSSANKRHLAIESTLKSQGEDMIDAEDGLCAAD
jgi:hypothetical protein